MTYSGPERRKHPRINVHFIISYRVFDEEGNADISQSKNVSLGGMLLTTNCQFEKGTKLSLDMRLPFDPNPLMVIARVLDSKQIIQDLIYDTRLEFLAVDEKHRNIINQTVNYYLKKE